MQQLLSQRASLVIMAGSRMQTNSLSSLYLEAPLSVAAMTWHITRYSDYALRVIRSD